MRVLVSITLLAALLNVSYAYFWTSGTKLMDANKKEFVARGINVASADWDAKYSPSVVMKAVAATGANAVRILWLNDNEIKKKSLNDNNLVNAIKEAINNRLVPMVHLWVDQGPLGDSWDNRQYLKDAGKWWVSKIPLLRQFEDKLLINVLNEWSTWKKGRPVSSPETAGHSVADILWYADDAIIPIRKAGWRGTLVIDSLAMAQSPWPILKHGQELINKDPAKNLIFSIHAYADWRAEKPDNTYTPYDKAMLAEIVKKGLPLILGEFSDVHPDSKKVNKYIDAKQIMKICQDNRIGWFAWSWKGNGVVNGVDLAPLLDISKNHDSMVLTEKWGKLLVEDANGFKSGQRASYFPPK